jgi:hypothetical protein
MWLAPVVASAAERYVEVWNPPESQTFKAKSKTHGVVPVQSKKKRKNVVVKQVADKTNVAPPALTAQMPAGAAGAGRTKLAPKPVDPTPHLPPLIGPDGRVLRV